MPEVSAGEVVSVTKPDGVRRREGRPPDGQAVAVERAPQRELVVASHPIWLAMSSVTRVLAVAVVASTGTPAGGRR